MSSLVNMLFEQLGGDATRQISRNVGADEDSVSKAVSGALPVLLGALQRNAGNSEGAQSLAGALDRDHDGSILDDIAGFLGQNDTGSGEGILRHALGQRQPAVEAGLGRMSGLDADSIGKILSMLAPLVMGMLGREQRSQGLDISGLTGFLGAENEAVGRAAPDAMGFVGQLLDTDGDGDITDDLGKLGGGLLGSLFGGKR